MKTQMLIFGLALVCLLGASYGDGMIIPCERGYRCIDYPCPPCPMPPPERFLEVKYHHVDVQIDNQYVETSVDQVFHNPNNYEMEGTYLFPLTEGATVQSFSMWVDSKELKGEVLDREKARDIYEDIVRQMKDPALLEYVDRNTFRARVYPIPARGDKKIEIKYSEVISCESGICEYTYPLNTEKFSSKNLDEVVITVHIASNQQIKSVYSPTHKVLVSRKGDYEAEVSFEENDVKPDKDFKLFYTVSSEDVAVNLLAYKEENELGFFMLMAAPRVEIPEAEVLPKDVVLILDTSGSMAGDKIEQAKKALNFVLDSLNSYDSFSITTFSTEVDSYSTALTPVSSGAITSAKDYVNGIEAIGGTDIDTALMEGLQQLRMRVSVSSITPYPNPQYIIFLTDGQPTVGVQDINKILEDVEAANTGGVKLFVFGVGYDVNTHLLDKLSLQNHGDSEYVEPSEDIEVKVSNFYEKISSPVLSDIGVFMSNADPFSSYGVHAYDTYPKDLPDLFKGSQLIIFGRYSEPNQNSVKLTVRGKVGSEEIENFYTLNLPEIDLKNDFIPRLWATRKIADLLDTIRLEGESRELIDSVIALSKKYGIATPYTSFLVIEDEKVAREEARSGFTQAFAPMEGAGAVAASKTLSDLSGAQQTGGAEQEVTYGGVTSTIKYASSKTFIGRNGRFVDTAYAEGAETKKLSYGSDAYFRAIADNPGLGEYLSVGKNVVVCFNFCIEVAEGYTGAEDAITGLDIAVVTGGSVQIAEVPGGETTLSQVCQTDSDCGPGIRCPDGNYVRNVYCRSGECVLGVGVCPITAIDTGAQSGFDSGSVLVMLELLAILVAAVFALWKRQWALESNKKGAESKTGVGEGIKRKSPKKEGKK